MDRFAAIDDAQALLRTPKGVYKQVAVYHCGGNVYVPHSGGFVRVCPKVGDSWPTSNPDVKVVDIDQSIPGLFVVGTPKYIEATKET